MTRLLCSCVFLGDTRTSASDRTSPTTNPRGWGDTCQAPGRGTPQRPLRSSPGRTGPRAYVRVRRPAEGGFRGQESVGRPPPPTQRLARRPRNCWEGAGSTQPPPARSHPGALRLRKRALTQRPSAPHAPEEQQQEGRGRQVLAEGEGRQPEGQDDGRAQADGRRMEELREGEGRRPVTSGAGPAPGHGCSFCTRRAS